MFMQLVFTLLISTTKCANILGVVTYPSISHQIVFSSIWRELSLRGHNVTVVTPVPLQDLTLSNITEIRVNFPQEFWMKRNRPQLFSKQVPKHENIKSMYKHLNSIMESELNSPQFQQLILNQNATFDLIILQRMGSHYHALGYKYKAPVIAASTFDPLATWYDIFGNPNHPAFYPDLVINYPSTSHTLWQKIWNLYFTLFNKYYYYYLILPYYDLTVKKYFGDNVPNIGVLERDASMFFVNRNPVLHLARPHVPAVIDVSPVHLKTSINLPSEIQNILDEAKKGVIYVSFGSNLKISTFGEQLKKNIVEALSELPYKILWKCEDDELPKQYDNIITRKWFPQADLLAHPNVKAFVTHGGQLSIEEAISREIPLIGIPFVLDQPNNMHRVAEIGIGETLDPSTLTKNELSQLILKVAETKSYKEKIQEARKRLLDKSITGLDTVIWWSEYVIRHKRAHYFKSRAIDMPMYEYLILDVIILPIFGLAIVLYLIFKLFRQFCFLKQFTKTS